MRSPKPNDRTPAAEALLAAGGVISVQVMNELVSVARRSSACRGQITRRFGDQESL